MTATSTEKETFQDIIVEWKILNKLLQEEYRDYINRLTPALFTNIRKEVYRAMQLAFTKYGTVTYEGVHEFMNGKVPGELLAANNGDLRTLITQAVRLAKKRQVKERAILLTNLAQEYDPNEDQIREALDFDPLIPERDGSLASGMQKFIGNLHAKMSGDYTFAHTGFKFLDRHMGGEWKPKSFIVLAGDVGTGKTTLWINSSKKMAQGYVELKTGQVIQTPSLFFSLEMTKEDLILKMVGDELNIDTNAILAADFDRMMLDHPEWDTERDVINAVENKMAEIQELPLYVIDDDKITLPQMIYEIRKYVYKYNVRVVAIDYMQIVNHMPTGSKNSDLGDFALELKELAKRENITIIVLSQINSKDGTSVIRDSGEVKAVADVMMQIVSDDDEDNVTSKSGKYIHWLKNRFGKSGGKTAILFNGAYQRFEEG